MPISDRLKALRAKAGLSQEALAHQAGVSGSLIRKIEQGMSPDPRMSTLVKLAAALGVTVDKLAIEDKPPATSRRRKKGK
jgi:transcriptional regulator with XRE-family HTH domain